MRTLLLLCLTTLFTANSWADSRAGNGGDAVVCFFTNDGKKDFKTKKNVDQILQLNRTNEFYQDPLGRVNFNNLTAELLDLYLARQATLGEAEKLITSNYSFKELVQERIEQIESKSLFAKKIHESQESLSYSQFKGVNTSIREVNDSGHIFIDEAHCSLIQLGVRLTIGKKLEVKFDRRIFISAI